MTPTAIDLATNIGMMSLLGLSAYVLLLAGMMSFGQQAFFGIGAYAAGIATAMGGLPLLGGLAVGVVAGALSCFLLGSITVRLRGIEFAIATLAFAEIVRVLLKTLVWQVSRDGRSIGPDGVNGFAGLRVVLDEGMTPAAYAALVVGLVVVIVVGLVGLEQTGWGRALRATGEDPILAAQHGIDVALCRRCAAGLAGALAGLGGALYAHHTTYIEPSLVEPMLGIHALAYALIGGLGTAFGPLLGTALDLGLLASLRGVSEIRMILFGGLIAICLIWLPRGLLDERRVRILAQILPRVRAPQVHHVDH